jgi:hypothetical protein
MDIKGYNLIDNDYLIKCPHCCGYIIINKKDLNCKIFRHHYKGFNEPHASKEICDKWLLEDIKNKVYNGCTKPFKFDPNENNGFPIICEYI